MRIKPDKVEQMYQKIIDNFDMNQINSLSFMLETYLIENTINEDDDDLLPPWSTTDNKKGDHDK